VEELLRRQFHSALLQHLVIVSLEILDRFEFDFI
jgi:hypothetical protein